MTPTSEIKRIELVKQARLLIGTTEVGGDNKGPMIEKFQRAVDGIASREAWCLGFVWYCVAGVDSLAPQNPSWLYKTEHCLTLWDKTPKAARITDPQFGSIVVWQYFKDGKPTNKGHVGIIKEIVDNKSILTIEGNTGPGKEVVREGDGVYEKRRLIAGSSDMRVKGFLLPWNPEL